MPEPIPAGGNVAPAATDSFWINPSGEMVRVDAAMAPKLASLPGFHLAPPDLVHQFFLQQEYGGAGQSALAGAEGFGRALTLGLSTHAEKALGVPEEGIAAREGLHPVAGNVGFGLGMIAPLLGAPEAVAGKAALEAESVVPKLTAPYWIDKIGKATKGAVVDKLAPESAIGKFAANRLGGTAGSFVEGAFYGLGNAVDDTALGDHDLNAEALVAKGGKTILGTAALAGGLGLAGGLLGDATGFARPKVAEWLQSVEAKQYAKALGAEGAPKGLLNDMADLGLVGPFTKPEAVKARAEALLASTGVTAEQAEVAKKAIELVDGIKPKEHGLGAADLLEYAEMLKGAFHKGLGIEVLKRPGVTGFAAGTMADMLAPELRAGGGLLHTVVTPEGAGALATIERNTQAVLNKATDAARGLLNGSITPHLAAPVSSEILGNMERVQRLAANVDQLTGWANDHTRDVAEHAPNVALSAQAAMTRAVNYLAQTAPQGRPPSGLDPGGEPSRADQVAWNQRWETVRDPVEVLSKGVLSTEVMDTLKTVYPKLYGEVRTSLLEGVAKDPTIPYQRGLQISRLLDVPLYPSQNPQDVMMNLASSSAPPPPAAPGAPKFSKSGAGKIDASQRAAPSMTALTSLYKIR